MLFFARINLTTPLSRKINYTGEGEGKGYR